MTVDFRSVGESQSTTEHGFRPDYGSGPWLALMVSAVRLARSDLTNPIYSEEARLFLEGDLVALFADCLGYEGSFL